MVFKSGPATLIPTGVLIPVANISIRVLIGMTHALVRPGNFTNLSNSAVKLSVVTPSRH